MDEPFVLKVGRILGKRPLLTVSISMPAASQTLNLMLEDLAFQAWNNPRLCNFLAPSCLCNISMVARCEIIH